jgi:hypothetical protein
MNADERQLITDLFNRMRSYGTPDKDRDAETLINQLARATPDATYMLVQSVLVQEQALQATNERVQDLEEQLRAAQEGERPRDKSSGGFLGGFWGGRREEPRSSVPVVGSRATPSAYDNRGDGRSPWGQSGPQAQPQQAPAASTGGGGGFMRSALTTAAGVAGGMLVADSLRNMLGGGAHASPHHDGGGSGGGGGSENARYADDSDNDPGTSEPAAYQDDGNDPGFDSGGGSELDI